MFDDDDKGDDDYYNDDNWYRVVCVKHKRQEFDVEVAACEID